MNEKELKEFHEKKKKEKQEYLKKVSTVKSIYYIGKNPTPFKGKILQPDSKHNVNQIEYDDLIQDRHFISEEDFEATKKARAARLKARTEPEKKKKKDPNPKEVSK